MKNPASAAISLLIEPSQFKALQSRQDMIIVDIGSAERFAAMHIPGAIHITPGEIMAAPPVPGLLPDTQKLKTLLHKIGLNQSSHLIVYDDEGGGWAGRLIWILDSLGHKNYSYLNGGLVAWHNDEHPLESGFQDRNIAGQPPLHAVQIPEIDASVTATMDQVLQSLDDPDTMIWDARSPLEYSGINKYAAKAGHIPGAINFEWTRAMDQDNALRIRNVETLKKALAELGLSTDKSIITHCQTHHRSGLTYLVAKLLGFKEVKAYAGSWSEWGNSPETPVV
jgi:thiosulfate/3-mercaptopyruvate sulfurtransferase